MTSLKNTHTDLEIGITSFGAYKQPALYIQEGRNKRVLATFFSKEKADMFIEKLRELDAAGGNDND